FSKLPVDGSKLPEFEIKLNDDKELPIYHKPRRCSPAVREETNRQVEQLLKDEFIKPSTSPWAFPVVMVPKRDGTKRMCIDYVKLNEVTTPIRHPLPKMDETLDQLAGATIFGSMDLRNGFFQIKMSPESMKYTSFVTYNGQFEWKRMPFGLRNA
ncbi:Transposon Ty3-G Gag-Pol polyprotein, partial [Aduncisulcus paluster]